MRAKNWDTNYYNSKCIEIQCTYLDGTHNIGIEEARNVKSTSFCTFISALTQLKGCEWQKYDTAEN